MNTHSTTGRASLHKRTYHQAKQAKVLSYKSSTNKKISQTARSKKRAARELYINQRVRTELNHARRVQQALLQERQSTTSSNYFLVIGMLVVTAFFVTVASIGTI